MKLKCGSRVKEWHQAKQEVRAALIERAKAQNVISYSELAVKVIAIKLEPQSFALRTMLREIVAEENAAGRGMLTALVVYSSGDMQPGPGFFDLAGRLGKNTNDILRCWIKELMAIGQGWRANKRHIASWPNNHELPFVTVGRWRQLLVLLAPFPPMWSDQSIDYGRHPHIHIFTMLNPF